MIEFAFFLLHSVHFYKIGFHFFIYEHRALLGAVILWRRRSGQTKKILA